MTDPTPPPGEGSDELPLEFDAPETPAVVNGGGADGAEPETVELETVEPETVEPETVEAETALPDDAQPDRGDGTAPRRRIKISSLNQLPRSPRGLGADAPIAGIPANQLPIVVVVAILVVVGLVAAFTGATASTPAAPPVVTAAVTSQTLVCPSLASDPTGTTTNAVVADLAGALTPPSKSSGTVTSRPLGGGPAVVTKLGTAPAAVIASKAKVSPTLAISANGSVAASLAADQIGLTGTGRYRALTDSRCEAPAVDWWFAGANGNVGYSDSLTIANTAPTVAQVAISLWGPKGSITNPRLEAIRVRPHNVLHITIPSVAPDAGPLTVHVHATSGSVTAALLDRRTTALDSNGGDYLPPTTGPSRSAVVSGFVASQGAQSLVIGNPGDVDATVGLKIVSASGEFTPTQISQVVVPAGRTVRVNVARALDGSSGAVLMTSDQPVVGQGASVSPVKSQRPDITWVAATPALRGPAAVAAGLAPDGGHTLLLLTAPAGAAEVKVTTPGGQSTTVSVPAQHSVSVDITTTLKAGGGQQSFVATPVGNAPVYGVRLLSYAGAHGALTASEPLLELPTPIVLPPVRFDPRVATR